MSCGMEGDILFPVSVLVSQSVFVIGGTRGVGERRSSGGVSLFFYVLP